VSGSKKISELTSATVLSGDEFFPLVQSGETRQANVRLLDIFHAVRSVNGLVGDVIIAVDDIPGIEPLVIAQGVSAAIEVVSVAVSNVAVRVDETSAALTSVQTYLLSQISVAAAGGITDAPSDGSVYARQNASWQVVPVTALQAQIDAVSVLASVNAASFATLQTQVNTVSALASANTVAIASVSARIDALAGATEDFSLACSDETTAITTGTAVQFSFPRGMQLSSLVFECNVAPTSTTCELEVRVSSSVLHANYVYMDPGKTTTRTAATSTSLIKTSIVAWRRAFVSVRSTDATFAGLKLYLLGTPL
jgi:hypothetical protein